MRTHGKRRACPNCSCSIFMAYADDYVYIDERRLRDGAQYTKSSYLSNLHREYQCHKQGICVGHIYTKSDGLPPDYTFDPPDIPKFDEDANWIQPDVFSILFRFAAFVVCKYGFPSFQRLDRCT